MPSYAWAGWICFESEVEVEAAKSVPYCRLVLRAVQLSSEVYTSCRGEGLRCNVLYPRRSLNFQYSDRVKPLEILTSLWCAQYHSFHCMTQHAPVLIILFIRSKISHISSYNNCTFVFASGVDTKSYYNYRRYMCTTIITSYKIQSNNPLWSHITWNMRVQWFRQIFENFYTSDIFGSAKEL
jgi:hypothetical protein